MKLTIEVDQSRWQEVEEINLDVLPCETDIDLDRIEEQFTVYKHDEYIYLIVYDWDTGIYIIIRPCGRIVACVQDLMIAQSIVELIATNRP
jgi:hypothetical protein